MAKGENKTPVGLHQEIHTKLPILQLTLTT